MPLASSPRLLRSFLAFLLLIPGAASAATFTLSPTSLSFGSQVVSTTSSAKTITLTNTGASVLAFTAVPSTGEFIAASACAGGVNPGATCNITVQFRPSALGARSATLVVTDTTNPANTSSAALTGTGVAATTVATTSLSFGNVVQGATSPAKKVKFTNNQDVQLTGLTFTSSNPDFVATGCGSTLGPRKTCTESITFTPTAAPGTTENATLTITHSAVTSPQSVALSGKSVLPLSLSAAALTFPATAQGTTKILATLKLTNNQPISLTNISYALTGPFTATGCVPPLGAGKSCTLSVTFAPTAAHIGLVTGSITISSTNPTAWNHPVATLSGTATLPIIFTPNPLNVGDTTVGSTGSAKTLSIKNNLTRTLNFAASPFSFGGAAAPDYARTTTTCGATLAAGATCTVKLTFHPHQGGARPATFIVASDAPGSPHSSALIGNGTTPITVSPSQLSFGNVGVGLASAPKLVTLQNNQSVAASIAVGAPTGNFAKEPATTCGTTLAAGASCTISITARPMVGGPQTGALTILEPPFAALNVPLSGTGINAITTSPSSLTFAQQKIGTTSISKQIAVTNHQNVPASLGTALTGSFAATDVCAGIVPALSTCVVSVTFTPPAVGPLAGSISFEDHVTATGRVTLNLSGTGTTSDPPASLTSVSPGAGTVGTVVNNVAISGSYTTFTSGTPTVSFGAGITVSGVTVLSDTSLVVGSVSIDAGAIPGARNVQVTNGATTASLTSGFVVSASAAKSFSSIAPHVGTQGQTLNVSIVGSNTHFAAGVTTANFGDNVYVNGAVQVIDQTHATANITISPTAVPGWRAVTVVTGGEYATLTPIDANGPGFHVIRSGAAIASISPASGEQGAAAFSVTVVGTGTHFLQGASVLSLGGGINVGSVTVDSPTQLHATIAVTAGAAAGLRDVTVTTGGEIATRAGAFTVTPSATIPYLGGVSPNTGQQGQTLTLTLTGVNTHFTTDAPAPSLEIGSNITVNSLAVLSDTSIQANVSIDLVADVGARGGVLASGATNYPFTFVVTPSTAAIVSVSPGSTGQGTAISVTVTGIATHWSQDTTAAWFPPSYYYCPTPQVDRVTINSATSAVLDITVPANGCVGPNTFQMSTGGEVVGAALNVYRKTPSLSLSPSSAMVGSTVTVNFVGEFSHFAAGSTTAVIDGTGVQMQNFTVTGPASATAKFVIAPDAPSGSCYSLQPGCHTVTVTTPVAAGSEILTALFQVTSTPAVLVSIDPSHVAPGGSAFVRIIGSYTHFLAGTTTVGLGPDVSVSAPTIVSPTELTVNISVGSNAAIGWRSAYVNTGSEQVTIGFRVDGPAAPAIASVSPSSAAQGETLFVSITGQNTNFSAASELILGAGVTVADFQVTSPTTATAVVAVSPTAPIGPNTVIVLTPMGSDQEIASGVGFSVTRGPSQILSVTPAVATQSQILNIALVGEGTHWLQGGSAADFGAGVVVNALTVADATHASAQVTILSTAPLGFHTVSMQTDGEYVSMTQGLNITEATPVLLSSSPNSAPQATTFNVQVLGQQTHWVQGVTTASYGDGITVNSFTVLDSASGTINVTIDPLAFVEYAPGCHNLTVTTGTEQVSLASQLCVQPGAAIVTNVNPHSSPKGQTLTVTVTGQNTHFTQGLTTADFGIGINTSAVTVTSPTSATLDLAVTSSAPNGYHSATLRTVGEVAYSQYAFIVGSGTPRLASAAPTAGQQGQSLTVRLLGEFTHWVQGTTTVTFGTGITVNTVTIVDATTADVAITVDPLTFIGDRLVTATTGGEIVSANKFSVVAGPAIIANSTPQSGNQGQDIILTLTGLNTHWAQGATQFSMAGVGGDIKLNYFLVGSPTSATAGITISPTAGLGSRSIYMITGGESLVSANAFVVTGGIPAVASVSPGSGTPGDTSLNVQIAGLYTHWDSTSTVDFGPGITVQTFTVNSSTSITAVIDIGIAAGLGTRTVTVRTGTQALTGYFQVVSPTPPTPYIWTMSPPTGLRGQTFTVTFGGQYTHWDPATSTVTFGDPGTSGITINSFQVTSPTTARANITISPTATIGPRLVEIATGTELEQATFSVVVATPVISIVDPGSAMQGATLDLNVLGQNTTFDASTVFDFGTGITVNSQTILGPTVAQVNITISVLATLGGRGVTATTSTEVAHSIYGFAVTPSLAVVKSVTPNTAKQRDTLDVDVVGENTHWDGTTTFYFGSGISVTGQTVTSPTTATVTITLAPLAQLGAHSLTATTAGEVASLTNAFIVQPGTPLILSSGPGSGQQQQNVSLTILGQFTQWVNGTTTVSYGSGVTINTVNVTSPISITVGASIEWWAQPGYRTLTVTTGSEVLTLPGAFYVTNGPAAISALNPASSGQGETHDIIVTGVNTHFTNGVTTGAFGPGISVNSVSVASATAATVNITVAANATPGQNSVALYTQGETAGAASAFTILSTTPKIQFVTPTSAAQGATLNVSVIGSLSGFTGSTTFDFGPGITVNSKSIVDTTHATVNITISPLAARTTRTVCATTGATTACGTNLFTVTAGPAYISAISPASGKQNRSGLVLTISGNQTHFLAATPTVALGPGVTVTSVSVTSDTLLTATVNISPTAPVQTNDVTVTTLGEVAVLAGGFSVLTGDPVVSTAVPVSAHQADTLDVAITGMFTHFVNGTTSASFGSGIGINSVTVTSPTQATVNITIHQAAATGSRNVTMTTGTEVATGLGVFTVLAGVPSLDSINPTSGAQGSTQTLTITGLFTHFQSGVSTVSFSGTGVNVGAVTVNGPTQIQVPVTVTVGAPAGARTVTVATGAESVSKLSAFTVLPGDPKITVINPNVGVPNSTVPVSITGEFTNFVNGTTQARFGAGISVNGGVQGDFGFLNVTSPTTATATLTIASAAALGARDVRVQTGAEVLDVNAGFTVQSATPTAPGVTFVSPAHTATGVPTNTAITLQFSAPLNRTTVSTANIRLVDTVAQGYCYSSYAITTPGAVSVDASGRIVTFTPAAVLAVGRPYQICVNYGQQGTPQSIEDPAGHDIVGVFYNFTTGFAPDTSGPSFIAANIADGDTNVPTNAPIVLGFTKPINPATVAGGLSITAGGSPAAGTLSYTADYQQITFTPSPSLAASTIYVVSLTTGLEDSVGNPLTNPGTVTFTTGTATDPSAPTLVSTLPGSGAVTGTEPLLRATFNKPLNPLRETPAVVYLYDQGTGVYLQDGTVQLSGDRKTITLVPARPLEPGTYYNWYVTAYNVTGAASSYAWTFRTTGAADITPPSVVAVSPQTGASAVPINVRPQVVLDEPIDASLVTLGSTPSATFTSALSADRQTLTFTPSTNLAPSTSYTVTLNGVSDLNGNAMAPYVWSFTTSAVADTTAGTMTATPASGATGVARTTPVVLSLSEAVNLATVNLTSFRVFDNTLSQDIAGAITNSADLRTLTFTPTVGYVAGHQVCVYAGYFAFLKDLAGNNFSYVTQCFSVAAAPVDTTPPTVVSVAPFDGATGIGPSNPVTVSFSESMRTASLSGNAALYVGSDLVSSSFNVAPDGTSLTFGYTLSYGTTYTIIVSPGATDAAGNSIAALFRSTFTTAPRPVTTRPQVVPPSRPSSGATGVDPSASAVFFLNQPIDPTTVSGDVLVSQDGVLLTGTATVSHGNRVITFVPSAPFAPGALIEVWLTSGITDTTGNPLYDYQTSFRIAPTPSVGPSITSYMPAYGANAPSTTVIDIRLSKPVNPATITSSTFYMATCGSTPVAATRQMLNGNRVLRLRPVSPLAVGCYYYYLTSAVTDMSGLPLTNTLPIAFGGGVSGSYFNAVSTSDTTSPSVVAAAPTDGAVNIGANAVIRLTFSESIATYTIDPSTLSIQASGSPIPYDVTSTSANPDGTMTVRLTPGLALPASSPVTVTVTSGVTDFSGNPAVPFTETFTIAATPDFSAPSVIASSVVSGDLEVPVTSVFTATFDRPMEMRSFVSNNTIYLYESLTATYLPHTLSFSADRRQVTLSPAAPLAVGRAYTFTICGVMDLTGNSAGCYSASFTTALFASAGGPVVIQLVPSEGLTVPVNFKPRVQFDRAVSRPSFSSVTLTAGAVPVPFTAAFSTGDTIAALSPSSLLLPNTSYTLTITGVKDTGGQAMAAPVVVHFTTGPATDTTAPAVVGVTPPTSSVTGTNPVLRIYYNEPIDPVRAIGAYLYNNSAGRYAPGFSVAFSPQWTSLQATYAGALAPNSFYSFCSPVLYDLSGNYGGQPCWSFFTDAGADASAPSVVSATPPDGAAGVPRNAVISARFSERIDPTSLTASSGISLSPAAAGTQQLSSDGMTLTYTLSANLSASTLYTLNVAGLADLNGNALTPFASTFMTGSLVDTVPGAISMTTPAPGSSSVGVGTPIVLTLNKAVNPTTVTPDTFVVWRNNTTRLAGSIAIGAGGTTLTFTPQSPLPPSSPINVYGGYYAVLRDLAGNQFNYLYNASFTTAAVADTTAPYVVSISPANGATDVGPLVTVTMAFSESLDPSTVNTNNFSFYSGFTRLSTGLTVSSDNRMVMMSSTLPYDTLITVVVDTDVTDINGNPMAAPFQSSFRTLPQALSSNPTITVMRPGNGTTGIPTNTRITLYATDPIAPSSVAGHIAVTQSGVQVTGSVAVAADGYALVFTPTAPLAPGALIQVFVTTGLTNTSGTPFQSFMGLFYTAADLSATPLSVSSYFPPYGSTQPGNTTIEVVFNKPIDPAYATSTYFYLYDSTSTVIPAAVTQVQPNVLRMTPSVTLAAGSYYWYRVFGTIRSADGMTLGSQFDSYFYAAAPDAVLPVLQSVVPLNGATNVGDNAAIRFSFNKVMDTPSINTSTVTLKSAGVPVAFSLAFGSTPTGGTAVTLTPQAPLDDNATVDVIFSAEIRDRVGQPIGAQTVTFQTGDGPDVAGPVLLSRSPDPAQTTGVPTNTQTYTWVYNEVLSPAAAISSNVHVYPQSTGVPLAGTIALSPDGKRLTLTLASPLNPSTNYTACSYNPTDMTGNIGTAYCVGFTTAATASATGPQVIASNPTAGVTGAARNASIEVLFDKAVDATSVVAAGAVTLKKGAVDVPFTTAWGQYFTGRDVRITPAVVLDPNATYTVTVTGVRDLAGIAMSSPYSYSFTTGPDFLFAETTLTSASAVVGGIQTLLTTSGSTTGVSRTAPLQLTFTNPVTAASVMNGGARIVVSATSEVIPVTVTMSADGKTVTLTPVSSLAATTQYQLQVNYGAALFNEAGYQVSGYSLFNFTTTF